METLRQIGDALLKADSIAVLSHVRPDGDAIGSAVALAHVLSQLGKQVTVLNEDGVPSALEFLPGVSMVKRPEDLDSPLVVDITLVLDTASEQRAGDAVWAAFADRGVLVNLDHHISNPGYGDLNFIAAKAPATGEIVFDLIKTMDWPLDETSRYNIWAGISTDTGSFRYPSTTAHTFEVGAELMRGGVDVGGISQDLYESYPLRRIFVLRELLKELLISCDGKVASWKLRRPVIDEHGVQPSDTEGLIDVIRSVDSVVVSVFFEEMEDGKIRVSARSKTASADVGKICAEFGGGGHQLAAGTRMAGSIDEAAVRFLSSVEKVING